MNLSKSLSMFLICFHMFGICEENRDENIRRPSLRKQKIRKGKRRHSSEFDSDLKNHLKAVTVNYPTNLFTTKMNWNKPATSDGDFLKECESSGSWKERSKAQDQEDIWLFENWFYGMKNGESGALDGLLFSTSYFFETVANWTAVHVEADPENYNNLISNRPNALNIHGALCSESKPLHYSSEGVIPVRGFVEFMTPSFIKKWHGKIYNNITKIEDLRVVQCLPVKHLFQQLNIHHVDIWILDVEGAEESVLKGTDFSSVRFNAVAMECDAHDLSKNARKTDILEANGFKCALIERNCMCKHKDFRPSARKDKSVLKMYDGQKWSKTYVNKGFSE